jgi:REP element-mobilizing transposase RayT
MMRDHRQDGHATLAAPMSAIITVRRGAYLPHWTRGGGTYAVTFRLADSLPQSVVESWEFERRDILGRARQMNRPLSPAEQQRLDRLFSEKVEKYLDAGAGKCWMQRDDVARVVAGALEHLDAARYRLFAWCVMPNHVHTVVQPLPGHELPEIVHSWKSFAAKEANRLIGRTGQFWQPETYDHLIRDERDFQRQLEYVLTNPAHAGLQNWKWVSDVARASRP